MKIKYRDHRGSLDESMKTVQEFETKQDLVKYLKENCVVPFYGYNLRMDHYCFDKRINWDTYIVTIKGFGVVGFANGLLN